jgi:hypothetical protein
MWARKLVVVFFGSVGRVRGWVVLKWSDCQMEGMRVVFIGLEFADSSVVVVYRAGLGHYGRKPRRSGT